MKKIDDISMKRYLFGLCWLVYFSTYLGRLNYSAGLVDIIQTQGFDKSEAGIIGMSFFLAYGAGQLISGFLGDRLSSKWMIFAGLTGSAAANAAAAWTGSLSGMTIAWTVNGFMQSFIWSPIIKIFSQSLMQKDRVKACINITSSVPIGTLAAYGGAAFLIQFATWKASFYGAAAVMLCVSILWLIGMNRVEQFAERWGAEEEDAKPVSGGGGQDVKVSFGAVAVSAGLGWVCLALVMQGILKDGVTAWVPTYISECYHVGSVTAILGTTVLPVFNLGGVYLASYVNRRLCRNELNTSGIFFLLAVVCLVLLLLDAGNSSVAALIFLALATTSMMAVNTMLVSVLPMYFAGIGRSSTASGVLNSSAYLGSAASTYGIGVAAQWLGWNTTIVCWCILGVMGAMACLAGRRRWKAFCEKALFMKKRHS